MKKILFVLILLISLSSVFAVSVEKATINVDAIGRSRVTYTLVVEPNKLEVARVPKIVGDITLLNEFDEPVEHRITSDDRYSEIIFTSDTNTTKLVFETMMSVNKIGEFWYFNTSFTSEPGATVIISLPHMSVVDTIVGPERTLTYAGTKTLIVESQPETSKFDIEIKYLIRGVVEDEVPIVVDRDYSVFLVPVIVFLLILFVVAYFKFKKEIKSLKKIRHKKPKPKKVKGKFLKKSVEKVLDKNESKVALYLKDVVNASHSQIHRATKLPKTTLTKVLQRLEKRNIVKKEIFGRRGRFSLQDWVFER